MGSNPIGSILKGGYMSQAEMDLVLRIVEQVGILIMLIALMVYFYLISR